MKKVLLLGFLALALGAFFYFGGSDYLSFSYIKGKQADFEAFKQQNLGLSVLIFSSVYIISTALSFPGAVFLTLLGGALFGLFWGTLIASFSSTMGATIAFLATRYLFREGVKSNFSKAYEKINSGFEKEGGFYLFSLRLIPIFPFFLVNLLMGLTSISTLNYFWISALGMLPGTAVYINAGTQLAELESLSGILSFKLILAFVLLGVLPILSKKLISFLRRKDGQ